MTPLEYLEEIDFNQPGVVEQYDELPLWSAPFGLMLLDRVPLKPGIVVVDVGAGTGFLTVELAQRCGPTARVIAVDPWKPAMSRLRSKVEYLGLANVVLLEQDAAALELPDESVDLIVSNLGVNNFDNAEAVLRECFRVARPHGRLFLTSNLVGHMAELYDTFRTTLAEVGQMGSMAALDTHINHRATDESVTRLLRRSGFETIDVATGSFRMRFANGSSLLRHYFIRLGFLPGWKSVVPPDAHERTFAALEHNLNARAEAHGDLALTIPMACIEARKVARESVTGGTTT